MQHTRICAAMACEHAKQAAARHAHICEPGDCTLSLHLANEDGAGRSASGTHGVSGAPGLSDRVMIVCCRTWKLLKDYGCGPREEACAVCCVHLHAADAFVVELCRALQPRLAAQACSERGGPVATIHCTTAKLCFGQATSWLQYRACSIMPISQLATAVMP